MQHLKHPSLGVANAKCEILDSYNGSNRFADFDIISGTEVLLDFHLIGTLQ